jgi:hypothetical protein
MCGQNEQAWVNQMLPRINGKNWTAELRASTPKFSIRNNAHTTHFAIKDESLGISVSANPKINRSLMVSATKTPFLAAENLFPAKVFWIYSAENPLPSTKTN